MFGLVADIGTTILSIPGGLPAGEIVELVKLPPLPDQTVRIAYQDFKPVEVSADGDITAIVRGSSWTYPYTNFHIYPGVAFMAIAIPRRRVYAVEICWQFPYEMFFDNPFPTSNLPVRAGVIKSTRIEFDDLGIFPLLRPTVIASNGKRMIIRIATPGREVI